LINTVNEWDCLKEVIVGDAIYANRPTGCHFKESGPYPNHIIAEATLDLNRFVSTLESEGVIVHRPKVHNFQVNNGMYNYCPRDRLLIIGDTVVDCNMQYKCREQELNYIDFVLKDAKNVIHTPRNNIIKFDAANISRLGNTLLYLESVSGTIQGADWLQQQFPNHTVEVTQTYGGVHIDSTFSPVADGLVVVNKDRVTKKTLPLCFKDWEVIWLGDEDLTQKSFTGEAFASNYILLNFFMINPKLAVIDDCPKLEQALRANGVLSYTVPFAHSRTLGGGHHCTTLDLHRG
jgi:N-dimethylarginine dimethylaminohydrolase